MERLIVLNKRLIELGQSDAPEAIKTLQNVCKTGAVPWLPVTRPAFTQEV
jgi:hypothetical protein